MNRALPTRLLAAYDGLLTRHRLATTTVSGALLGGAGDVVVQHAAASSDVDRTAAFFIFGGVLTGPINYRWLDFLAAASRSIAPQGGAAALAAKVALQSTVMQPLIYLPSFYLTNALVRRWSVAEAAEYVRAEYADTLRRLWLFWTPSVCFAFGVLPLRLQAVFFAGVGFAWNVVLSAYNGAGPQRVASVSQEQVRGV